jgi:uncharacterized coiled-coil protein SlyX
MADPAADLTEKDKRIDELVATAEQLVAELNDTVAQMKARLAAAAARREGRRSHGSG